MFQDRTDAGRQLATAVSRFRDESPIVVALPRGGVPVAYEVARALSAPLDVLVARKLGAPGHPELGIGAIAQGGALYLNAALVARTGATEAYLRHVAREESAEMARRLRVYRGDRAPLDVKGRTVILVDDGLATGATTRAAVRALRQLSPRAIVLAVPVCAAETATALRAEVDELVSLLTPEDFYAVGAWYRDFDQTSDAEVVALLGRATQGAPDAAARGGTP